MYPYKIVTAQELSEKDCETLCRELLQNVPRKAVMLFTNEALFHLSGTVKKQNFRYNNLQKLHQRPLHSPKVAAWYAIFEFGVWGLCFFEDDDVAVTVTSDRYCAMLENFLRPKLDDLFD
jgi:hypothetical protein